MKTNVNVIIVDDNPAFLDGLTSLLKRVPRYNIIGQYTSGDSLLEADPNIIHKCDIILIDIEMPGKNGIETTHILNKIHPGLKFIAITMYYDKVYLEKLIESGFRGFVNKAEVSSTLYSIIADVLNNKYAFPDNLTIN